MPPRKSSGKARAVEDSDEEDNRIMAKLANIDPQYLNQPLSNRQGDTTIKILIAELKLASGTLKASLELLSGTAEVIAESVKVPSEEELEQEIPEDVDAIKRLDKEFRHILDQRYEVKQRMEVLSDIRQLLAQGHQIANVEQIYTERMKPVLEKYEASTPRQRYLEDRDYEDFRSLIWDVAFDGRAVPNLKKFLPAEAGDDEDSDDDIEIGAQQHDFRCPLTLKLLTEPMTSKKCPHSFSGTAITQYLGRGVKGCPVAGCAQELRISDLREDDGLRKRVEAHQRRLAEDKANGVPNGTQGGKKGTQYEILSDDSEEEEDDDE